MSGLLVGVIMQALLKSMSEGKWWGEVPRGS